jgi:hypothetical protein
MSAHGFFAGDDCLAFRQSDTHPQPYARQSRSATRSERVEHTTLRPRRHRAVHTHRNIVACWDQRLEQSSALSLPDKSECHRPGGSGFRAARVPSHPVAHNEGDSDGRFRRDRRAGSRRRLADCPSRRLVANGGAAYRGVRIRRVSITADDRSQRLRSGRDAQLRPERPRTSPPARSESRTRRTRPWTARLVRFLQPEAADPTSPTHRRRPRHRRDEPRRFSPRSSDLVPGHDRRLRPSRCRSAWRLSPPNSRCRTRRRRTIALLGPASPSSRALWRRSDRPNPAGCAPSRAIAFAQEEASGWDRATRSLWANGGRVVVRSFAAPPGSRSGSPSCLAVGHEGADLCRSARSTSTARCSIPSRLTLTTFRRSPAGKG